MGAKIGKTGNYRRMSVSGAMMASMSEGRMRGPLGNHGANVQL
ncbi:hypothetical protein [Spirosoma daeguense]